MWWDVDQGAMRRATAEHVGKYQPAADALGIRPDTSPESPVAVAVGVDGRPVSRQFRAGAPQRLGALADSSLKSDTSHPCPDVY